MLYTTPTTPINNKMRNGTTNTWRCTLIILLRDSSVTILTSDSSSLQSASSVSTVALRICGNLGFCLTIGEHIPSTMIAQQDIFSFLLFEKLGFITERNDLPDRVDRVYRSYLAPGSDGASESRSAFSVSTAFSTPFR